MRTLWIAMCVAAAVGCGGAVSDEGAVDQSGCPVRAEDWAGTATLVSGCSGAPATLQVSGATNGSPQPGTPNLDSYGHQDGMCIANLAAEVSCGRALYLLKVQAR